VFDLRSNFLISVLGLSTALGWVVSNQDPQPTKQAPVVKRVKRPVFTERDWDGIYFENLFRDGLVGPRPLVVGSDGTDQKDKTGNPAVGETQATGTDVSKSGSWAKFISGEVLENEIKRLHGLLEIEVTTPLKFKSEYLKARQTYSMLSMWFAIIYEYPDDVRWKQYSAVAQPAFWRAAANSRTASEQAYQNARIRRDDLQEMIRGGAFPDVEKPIDELDWSQVVDRVPVMTQLQESLDELKQQTSSQGGFDGKLDQVAHRAAMIAAIGLVLTQENMDDADDEGYTKFANKMSTNALAVLDACKVKDFQAAASAVNKIDQSCNNCHEEWK
jgi:hypothetical protein